MNNQMPIADIRATLYDLMLSMCSEVVNDSEVSMGQSMEVSLAAKNRKNVNIFQMQSVQVGAVPLFVKLLRMVDELAEGHRPPPHSPALIEQKKPEPIEKVCQQLADKNFTDRQAINFMRVSYVNFFADKLGGTKEAAKKVGITQSCFYNARKIVDEAVSG